MPLLLTKQTLQPLYNWSFQSVIEKAETYRPDFRGRLRSVYPDDSIDGAAILQIVIDDRDV